MYHVSHKQYPKCHIISNSNIYGELVLKLIGLLFVYISNAKQRWQPIIERSKCKMYAKRSIDDTKLYHVRQRVQDDDTNWENGSHG